MEEKQGQAKEQPYVNINDENVLWVHQQTPGARPPLFMFHVGHQHIPNRFAHAKNTQESQDFLRRSRPPQKRKDPMPFLSNIAVEFYKTVPRWVLVASEGSSPPSRLFFSG
jgi:hypothetical protein